VFLGMVVVCVSQGILRQALRLPVRSSLRSRGGLSRRMDTKSKALSGGASGGKCDIVMDPFCLRQFEEGGKSSTPIDYDVKKFEAKINELYEAGGKKLIDGYATFCKHIFVPNFTTAVSVALKITPENEHLVKSGYKSRKANELAVLSRWFPREVVAKNIKEAKYLDIILYSREQIIKERKAMNEGVGSETAPWGIISVKPSDVDYETPMQPITMMRNALGREEGGSGVSLDKEKYEESVKYWSEHAIIS